MATNRRWAIRRYLDVGRKTEKQVSQLPELKPMPLRLSSLCFGIPAALGAIGLYVVLPALDQAGLSLLWNHMISVVFMFPLLLGAALVAYRLDGTRISWAGLRGCL